jgi:hypothetical protein
MRNIAIAGIAGLVLAIALLTVWFNYPAPLLSGEQSRSRLSDTEFSRIRTEAIEVTRPFGRTGLRLWPGEENSQSVIFTCNNAPVLVLTNGSRSFSILTFAKARERSHAAWRFSEQLRARLGQFTILFEALLLPHSLRPSF